MIKKQILESIEKHQKFLITTHINPDGDAIGSELAMANLLKAMGKTVQIVNSSILPQNMLWLPHADQIQNKTDSLLNVDVDAFIVMDCPFFERIGSVKQLFKQQHIINIDHHISNDNFGDIDWIDYKASSVGEMVYELFGVSPHELDDDSALLIYVAILTDTGSFRFRNTTVRTHEIIAQLMQHKIEPANIYKDIYETKSFETLKLLAEVLANLERSDDKKFVWFKVTRQMLKKYNLPIASTDDFIDYARMIEGAEVIAFLRELDDPHKTKVSLRSKSDVDVNKIAGNFGGGGHAAASGCVIEQNIDDAVKSLGDVVKMSFNA